MIRFTLAFLLFIGTSGYAGNAGQWNVCATSCDSTNCKRQFAVGTKKIDYYSNFPLNKLNDCIEKVIYVVHGNERNAESRYKTMLSAARSVGKQDRVLIISPFYKTSDDILDSKDLYWSSSGWKQGNTSNNSDLQVSSFEVADNILKTVIKTGYFRYLKSAAVTGHSAGGQFTQRYAIGSKSPQDNSNIAFQFLVLNPSSYTYLDVLRPHPTIAYQYEQPTYWTGSKWVMKPAYYDYAGSCSTSYNDYKYGLEERNSYMSRLNTSSLITQYISRSVYYFLGSLDTDMDDDDLDTTCEGLVQGSQRLDRGAKYFNYISSFYGPNPHRFGIVDGVGHDAGGMYGSTIVKNVLFN